MAKVNSSTLRNWNDGEVMYSQDYEQERSIIQTAINDNYDRLIKQYQVLDVDGTVKSTQSLTTALNDIKFKDSSTIVLSLDDTTSTLKMAIVDGSVTTQKLNDLGVTTAKLADGSVTTIKLVDLSVTSGKLALDSVITSKIKNDAVTDGKIGTRDVHGYVGQLTSILSKTAEQIASLSGYNNYEWGNLPVSNIVELKQRLDDLDSIYSTDSERIAAVNDVINQFEIADEDLEALINNKANKTDVYTKTETYTRTQTRSLVYDTDTEARVLYQGGTHVTVTHNLNDYPSVNVVAKNGFGHYGYGSGEYGSSGNFNIPASVDYPNENQVVVSLIENYVGNHTVTLSGNIARVSFPDEDGIYLDIYLRGNS